MVPIKKYIKGLYHGIKRTVPEGKKEVHQKITYAQGGEDILVDYIFDKYLKIPNPTYLDIGAYHPYALSNTAYFYEKGSSGVCVEPDPFLFDNIKKHRSRDTCLNAGIGGEAEEYAEFFIMGAKTLNTFSRSEAERYQSFGVHKIKEVIQIPLLSINKVIEDHFHPFPNFISIDVEGLDLEIIRTLNFDRYRPQVFCIETLTYAEDGTEQKISGIIEYMISKGYFLYADTYINSIFVDLQAWNNRNNETR